MCSNVLTQKANYYVTSLVKQWVQCCAKYLQWGISLDEFFFPALGLAERTVCSICETSVNLFAVVNVREAVEK